MTPRVPTRYLASAAYAWIDFIRTNPDACSRTGLADWSHLYQRSQWL